MFTSEVSRLKNAPRLNIFILDFRPPPPCSLIKRDIIKKNNVHSYNVFSSKIHFSGFFKLWHFRKPNPKQIYPRAITTNWKLVLHIFAFS